MYKLDYQARQFRIINHGSLGFVKDILKGVIGRIKSDKKVVIFSTQNID
jgi:hypothetical protein